MSEELRKTCHESVIVQKCCCLSCHIDEFDPIDDVCCAVEAKIAEIEGEE